MDIKVILPLLFLLASQDLYAQGFSDTGIATYYSRSWAGRKTASGEVLNNTDFTAAHRTLPFNTLVKVTKLSDSSWVLVRINDRGPFVKGRIIDLSYNAAKKLDIIMAGIAKVAISAIPSYTDSLLLLEKLVPEVDSVNLNSGYSTDSIYFIHTFISSSGQKLLDHFVTQMNSLSCEMVFLSSELQIPPFCTIILGPLNGMSPATEIVKRLDTVGLKGTIYLLKAD